MLHVEENANTNANHFTAACAYDGVEAIVDRASRFGGDRAKKHKGTAVEVENYFSEYDIRRMDVQQSANHSV